MADNEENRFSVGFAFSHSGTGTPIPPPTDPSPGPVVPEPFSIRLPGQPADQEPMHVVDSTGAVTPISRRGEERPSGDNDDNKKKQALSQAAAALNPLMINMPWIPSYLYQTAYGERFKNFGNTKQNLDDPDGIDAMKARGGINNDHQAPANDHHDQIDNHDYYEDSDEDSEPVNPRRFNLPQIFPSRSAAELDAQMGAGGWVSTTTSASTDADNRRRALDIALQRHVPSLSSSSDPYPGSGQDQDTQSPSSSSAAAKTIRQAASATSSLSQQKKYSSLYRQQRLSRKDIGVPALPTCWVKTDTDGAGVELGTDGCKIETTNEAKGESITLRTNHPIPKLCGVYYFEVHVESMGTEELISIGVCDGSSPLNKLPGLVAQSWGYHSDDGRIIACQGTAKNYGPKFGQGDVIGCGINFRKNVVFYTKNGLPLGSAFKDVTPNALYPCVGLKKAHIVDTNFGAQDFRFDIEKYIRDEKQKVFKDIDNREIVAKAIEESEYDDSENFVQELVASYFAHVGFLETARAFEKERNSSSESTSNNNRKNNSNGGDAMDIDSSYEDKQLSDGKTTGHKDSNGLSAAGEGPDKAGIEVYNRQKIRELILAGDIDTALKRLQLNYPMVLENNDLILFKLKCRKFVELVRKTVPMEDDDIEMGGTSSASTSSSLSANKNADVIQRVLQYGQELQKEYKDDDRPFVRENLDRIFALLAYEDPRQHPVEVAELFDREALMPLAEELNSEILVSMGKPSTPSLQRLAQHATQLVWEMSDQSISSANLINVREDYME